MPHLALLKPPPPSPPATFALYSNTDLYKCPYDPKTGAMEQRTITYNIFCDPTQQPGVRTWELVHASCRCMGTCARDLLRWLSWWLR